MMAASASGAQQQQGGPPPPPQQQQPLKPPRENPAAKLSSAFRSAAAASLNKRLHASLTAIAQQAAAEGEDQLKLQASLRQRGEQLQAEVAALQVGARAGQRVWGPARQICSALPGCCDAGCVSTEHRPMLYIIIHLLHIHSLASFQAERVALDKLSQDLAASSMQLDRHAPTHPRWQRRTHTYCCPSAVHLIYACSPASEIWWGK
jgi:hypothetical protein